MHDSARSSKATSPRCDDPHRALCAPARAALRAGALCLLLAVAAGASSEVPPGDGTSCAASAVESRWRAPRISTADGQTLSLEQLIGRLEAVDVVYIGEQHDRYDHHLHQLELLCRLWQRTPRIALAVEFFQHRFQSAADDFIRRHGDLDRLLLETEYFSRWGHDARLYAPLLEFASRHQIPLVALNADGALVRAVARHGLGSLDESQRRMLPDPLPAPGDTYTQRLAPIFEAHLQHRDGKPAAGQATLEFFVQAQSVWDQTMAQGIVELHRALPEHRIVVIAGNGHVGYDDAIPARVRASSELRAVVLVNAGAGAPAHEFDYQLRGERLSLPEAARLGVALDTTDGRLRVRQVEPDGAAEQAGVRVDDLLLSLDGRPLVSFDSLKQRLWRRAPDDVVELRVRAQDGGERTLRLKLR